jgi:hypothetical protein
MPGQRGQGPSAVAARETMAKRSKPEDAVDLFCAQNLVALGLSASDLLEPA